MRALLLRELAVIARHPAAVAAMCVHAGLLGAFVVVWGNGMPHLPGQGVYGQQRVLQGAVLSLLLPWTAMRWLPVGHHTEVAVLALMTARKPSAILLAQMIAGAVGLSVVVASGLPMVVLAQQMSAQPLLHAGLGLLSMLAAAAVAAVVVAWWSAMLRDRLAAWLGATGTTAGVGLISATLIPWSVAPLFVLFVLVVLGRATMQRADVSMRYLPEDVA